jgi:hypothetical protein
MLKNLFSFILFSFFFSLTLAAQTPANTTCATAIELFTTTDTATVGTLQGVFNTEKDPCWSSDLKAVWYKFVATDTRHLISFLDKKTNKIPNSVFLNVFGGRCDSLQSVTYCASMLYGQTQYQNFVIGQTYFIKVGVYFSTSTSFEIQLKTIPPPPSNDLCQNPTSLVPSALATCGNPVLGTNFGCVRDTNYITSGLNVWYKFTATSPRQQVKVTVLDTIAASSSLTGIIPMYALIYEANSCTKNVFNSLGLLQIDRDCYTQFKALEVGKEYLVLVGAPYSYHHFNVCIVTPEAPPVNVLCKNAIPLTANPINDCSNKVKGNTKNVIIQNNPTTNPSTHSRRLWYKFTGTGNPYKVNVTNIQATGLLIYTPPSLQIIRGNCDSTRFEQVTLSNNYDYVNKSIQAVFSTKINEIYYIVMDSGEFCGGEHTFDLCLSALPAGPINDEQSGSIAMPLSSTVQPSTWIKGETTFATHSTDTLYGLNNYQFNQDIWYHFTANKTSHTLYLRNMKAVAVSDYSVFISLVNLTDNNSIVQQFESNSFAADSVFTFNNLIAGKKYAIFIASRNAYGEGFSFEATMITTPIPINDGFLTATVAPVNQNWSCTNTVQGTTRWATPSFAIPFDNRRDIWFEFTATATQHKVSLQNFVSTNSNTPYFSFNLFEKGSDGTLVYPNLLENNGFFANLTTGKTYKIQVLIADGTDQTFFDVCVTTPITIIENTNCAKAITLPVNPTETPNVLTTIVTGIPQFSPVNTPGGCSSIFDIDDNVWYKFTATASRHILTISEKEILTGQGWDNSINANIYEGTDCNDLTFKACLSYDEVKVLKTTIGKNYLIQLFTGGAGTRSKFSFAITTPTPPSNDWCENATKLLVNSSEQAIIKTFGTFKWATTTQINPNGNPIEGDVWYQFTANATAQTIQFSAPQGKYFETNYSVLTLFEGNCTGLKHIYTNNQLSNKTTIGDLTIGKTYFIRFTNIYNTYPFSNSDFDIAITTPNSSPSNDDCADALLLPISSNLTCTPTVVSTRNATAPSDTSGLIKDACQQYFINKDVWFRFVATHQTHLFKTEGVTRVVILADSCKSKSVVDCFGQLDNPVWLSNLKIGRTYFLQAIEPDTIVKICLTTPPDGPNNDFIANATLLPVNPTLTCQTKATGTMQWAGGSPVQFNCAGNSQDVWYQFKATSTRHFIKLDNINLAPNQNGNLGFAVFKKKGNQLGDGVQCGQPSNTQIIVNNLTPDSTFFIQVTSGYNRLDTPNSFDLCVTTDPAFDYHAPANDLCENALEIFPNIPAICEKDTFRLEQATYTNFYPKNASTGYFLEGASDVWFKFVATDTSYFILNKSNGTPFSGYELYQGTCGNLTLVSTIHSQDKSHLKNLTLGKTYLLRIAEFNNLVGTIKKFGICLQSEPAKPSNDDCSGALPIVVNADTYPTHFVEGSTLGATTAPNIDFIGNACQSSHNFYRGNDLWYSFQATNTVHWVKMYQLQLETTDYAYPPNFAIYEGNCSGMTALNCDNGQNTRLTDLTIGKTYYVHVYNTSSNPAPYRFRLAIFSETNTNSSCITTPITIPLTLGKETAPIKANTASPFDYNNNPEQFSANKRFSVFEFEALSDNTELVIKDVNRWNDLYSNLEVYVSGTECTNIAFFTNHLTNIPYTKKETIATAAGQKFKLYFGYGERSFANFSFTLNALKTPNGGTCEKAIAVPVNPTETLTQSIRDTVANYNVDNNYYKAHWYKFTATQTRHLVQFSNSRADAGIATLRIGNIQSDCNTSFNGYGQGVNDSITYLEKLTIGQTYRFQITSIQTEVANPSQIAYNIGILSLDPGPSNDSCSHAIALTVGNDTICQNKQSVHFKNATYDYISGANCSSGSPGTWYSFVAKSATQVLEISNFSFLNGPQYADMLFVSYKGTSCTNLEEVDCHYFYSDPSQGNKMLPYILRNLTIGQKYSFKLDFGSTYTDVQYDLCLYKTPPPPINDECSNAILLPVNPTLQATQRYTGTTKWSNNTNGSKYGGDVWFKFVATGITHFVNLENGNGLSKSTYDIAIINNDCTTYDKSVVLTTNYVDSFPRWTLYNLVPGKTYFIQLKDENSAANTNYEISITTPLPAPNNDQCSNAILLTASGTEQCSQPISGTTTWAVIQKNPVCAFFQGDVWYKFVATSPTHRLRVTPKANFSTSILNVGFYTNDCTDITPVYYPNYPCLSNVKDSLDVNNLLVNLTVGETYLVQVYSSTQTTISLGTDFDICITTPTMPSNLTCANALSIPVSDSLFCTSKLHTVVKNVPLNKYSDTRFLSDKGVIWYKFKAKSTSQYLHISNIAKQTGNTLDYNLYWYQSCKKDSVPHGNDFFYDNFSGTKELNNLIIGQEYSIALVIGSSNTNYYDASVNFETEMDLCITSGKIKIIPTYDNPDGAKQLTVNNTWQCQSSTAGTTVDATPTPNINSNSCSNNTTSANDDVWFKFVATSTHHYINVKNIIPVVGDVTDMSYDVFRSDNGQFPNNDPGNYFVGCSDYRTYKLAPWETQIGKTYFIRIYTTYLGNYSRCSFDLCITTPIPQDEFKSAISSTQLANLAQRGNDNTSANNLNGACEKTAFASSVGATYSYNAGIPQGVCDQNQLPRDIWFKTIMTTGKPNLSFKFNKTPTGAEPQAIAYRLKNGVLENLANTKCPTDSLFNLVKGDTILFRVWDAADSHFGDYEICLNEFGKINSTDDGNCRTCNGLTIKPVPAIDDITVNISYLTSSNFTAIISNMAGQEVYHQKYIKFDGQLFITIPVGNLPQGTYLLLISDGQKMYNKRFVKM